MRRRTLYVCALLLMAAVALYFPLVGGTAASGQASDASKKRDLSNYDALAASKRSSRPEVSLANGAVETPGLQEEARLPMEAGHVVQMEGRLGVPTFLWATDSGKAKTLSAVAATRRADAAGTAFEHLGKYASRYRLSGGDIADLRVASVHDTGKGAIIVKLKQTVGGIEVFRDEMNVIMNRKLQLIAISGYVTGVGGTDTISVDSAASFKLTPSQAVASAAADLTGNTVSPAAVRATKSPVAQVKGQTPSSYFTADLGGGAQMSEPARVKQVMYHTDAGFVPAYYVEEQVSVPSESQGMATISEDGAAVQTDSLYYAYVISAVDGQLLFRKNLSENDAYTYRVWAGTSGVFEPFDGPQGNAGPYPTAGLSGFVPPFVSPNDVTLQNSPFSKNDPWLAPGATETNGNNVDGYVDLGSGDGFQAATDFRASVTAPGQFLHTFDPNALPNTNEQQQAAVQQLFYDNNFLHDWYYDSGFDEAAGNAQADNFGRGGIGGDSIKAEGQDSSGTNNANMATPSDGGRPRMQMYIFSGPTYNNVLSPAAIAGARGAGTWQSGPQSFDYTGDVFIPANFGCTATDYTGGSGKIALVNFEGGSCSFGTKRNTAIAAGATGFILVWVSTSPNQLVNVTGAGPGTTPLSTMSWNGAAAIKTQIGLGNTVNLRMFRGINLDGTIDNQVIFHEWGHYLSNRLIGDAVGIGSNQSRGMGEGWGDFNAMLLTVREGDDLKPANANFNGTYGIAGYATGHDAVLESAYYGIRRAPYSTDMTKNGYTFKNIMDGQALPTTSPATLNNGAPNSEVHAEGEIWATMLWECYASLLRDTGRLTFAQAQDRMKGYLVASLKMTPVNPTFTEARDAVLAAAYANDPLDGDLFMQAFAKRGMGINAVASDRFSTNNAGIVESYEVGSNLSLTSVSFNDDLVSCDTDGYLDNNEKGTLTVTLKNTGSQTLTNTVATVSSTNAGVKFPAGVIINFPAVDPLETTTGTLVVEGKGLAGIQSTDYTITFSDSGTANGQVSAAHFYAKLNVDESPTSSKNEDFESKNPAWTKGFNATLGNHQPWAISNNGADYLFHAPDVGGLEDQYLISPPMTVSTGTNFVLSFLHRHSFEFDSGGNYDGGRVEITTNGGTTWTPIGTSPTFYNGTVLNQGAGGNPIQGAAAFVKQNASYPNFDTATLDLGTTYQGQTVQIRFRAASDSALGAGGWDIASVNFTGIDNTPYTSLIADPGPCGAVVTLTMTPASLPVGTVNNAYSVVLNGAGGTGPYSYDAPSGLPNGLSSAPFGAGLKISGTPTESGSFPITVNFHDSASHSGSANYTLVVNKAAATISLSNLSQVYDGTPKEATATTTPPGLTGVTITYSQGGSPVASPTNAGSYDVLAQLSNNDYAAPDKTGTLVISKASQTINFGALSSKTYGDAPFTISATATSGLSVTFKVISGPAFLSGTGTTVNLTGAGTVKIRATQIGNGNYNAAPAVDQTFTVAKKQATLSVGSLSQVYTSAPRKVTVVTSPIGLAGVTVTYKQGGVSVSPINVGSYDVHVTLTNANYQATPVDTTLVITKATQKITFPAIANRQYSPTPFTISATSSSGLTVSFQVISGPATVSGNDVTMTGTGVVKIRATQAGSTNYIAAPYVDRSFTITP